MRLSKLTIQLHDNILFLRSTTFHNILPNEMDKVTFSNGRCDSKEDSNWRSPWWNPFKTNHQSLDNSAVSSLWGGFEVDSKLGSSRIHIIARWTEKACNSHCFKWTMTKKVMVIHQVTACLQKVAFYRTRGETANEACFPSMRGSKKMGTRKTDTVLDLQDQATAWWEMSSASWMKQLECSRHATAKCQSNLGESLANAWALAGSASFGVTYFAAPSELQTLLVGRSIDLIKEATGKNGGCGFTHSVVPSVCAWNGWNLLDGCDHLWILQKCCVEFGAMNCFSNSYQTYPNMSNFKHAAGAWGATVLVGHFHSRCVGQPACCHWLVSCWNRGDMKLCPST